MNEENKGAKEVEGVKATIALQKAGGITVTEEQAKKSWKAMSASERKSAFQAADVICPGWSDK